MVEFDSIDSAKRAKHALNGCDIYSGCCTLRVEFAKVCIFQQIYNHKYFHYIQCIKCTRSHLTIDFDSKFKEFK